MLRSSPRERDRPAHLRMKPAQPPCSATGRPTMSSASRGHGEPVACSPHDLAMRPSSMSAPALQCAASALLLARIDVRGSRLRRSLSPGRFRSAEPLRSGRPVASPIPSWPLLSSSSSCTFLRLFRWCKSFRFIIITHHCFCGLCCRFYLVTHHCLSGLCCGFFLMNISIPWFFKR